MRKGSNLMETYWYAFYRGDSGKVEGLVVDEVFKRPVAKETEEEIKKYIKGHEFEATCEFIEL